MERFLRILAILILTAGVYLIRLAFDNLDALGGFLTGLIGVALILFSGWFLIAELDSYLGRRGMEKRSQSRQSQPRRR